MNTRPNIFVALLKELNVPFTLGFANKSYEEHPYKYTFYGIKQLCEKYGIKVQGVHLKDKREITKMPLPIIVDYANDRVLVKRIESNTIIFDIYGEQIRLSIDTFMEMWGGNVLYFLYDENSKEPEYDSHKKNSHFVLLEIIISVLCSLLILILCVHKRFLSSAYDVLLMLTYIVGIALTTLLLMKQLSINNHVLDRVCHSFNNSDCGQLIENNAAKIWGGYSWAEIGFCYFLVNFFCFLISHNFDRLIAYLGIFAIPFSIWSVWYQKHISQWCPLCLMVQGVIVCQPFLLFMSGAYSTTFSTDLVHAGFLFSIYSLTLIIVHKGLPLLKMHKELQQIKWQYNHFRLNDSIFCSLLFSEEKFPCTGSTLIFGNSSGKWHITVFSNPYCNPCASMHKTIQKLIDNGNFQIQYIFTSFKPEWNIINKYMIAVYQQLGTVKAWEIYTEWYEYGKLKEEGFFDKFNLDLSSENVTKEFERHELWRNSTKLDTTPTILVNGHRLPYGYKVEDILFI